MDRGRDRDAVTIFVKGLPYEANEAQILDLDVFRKANSIDLKKGFGYLEFETEQDAEDCYAARFDAEMHGRKLFLDFVGSKSIGAGGGGGRGGGGFRGGQRGGGGGGGGYRESQDVTLFVKGLPFDVEEREILDLDVFRRAVSCDVKKGFGYLVFESERDAEDCYENRFEARMDGRNLFLDFVGSKSRGVGGPSGGGRGFGGGGRGRSPPRSYGSRDRSPPLKYDEYGNRLRNGGGNRNRDDNKTLFCKGLPFDASEKDILNLKWFKYASGCRVIVDHDTGKSKGFCYIDFESERDVEDAYRNRHDMKMDGRNLYLDYCGNKSNNIGRGSSGSRTRDRSPLRTRQSRTPPRYRSRSR